MTYPAINAHRDRIETMLATNTVTTVHQRLRDEHGLTAGISSFRRYVWRRVRRPAEPEAVTVWRPPVSPGSEAQIDYGYLGSWFDPIAGAGPAGVGVRDGPGLQPAHVRAAGAVDGSADLGRVPMSRRSSSSPGSRPRLVPDNLKTGVIKPDLYDPKINRAYAELAAHYGCLIDPARAAKPKDKARVERPMPYVRDSMWRGREWADCRGDADRRALTANMPESRPQPEGSRKEAGRLLHRRALGSHAITYE